MQNKGQLIQKELTKPLYLNHLRCGKVHLVTGKMKFLELWKAFIKFNFSPYHHNPAIWIYHRRRTTIDLNRF